MPAAPDCIIKVGTNLNLVARYWRKKGWKCADPVCETYLNWLMDNIELDASRYYPDPVNTIIEELIRRTAARVIKPLTFDARKKAPKGTVY